MNLLFRFESVSFVPVQLVGQTGSEELRADRHFASESADDRILHACLQLIRDRRVAALFTNDKNLANKAMVCGVDAFG